MSKVIVPVAGKAPVLDLLHDGNPGISKIKTIARSVVWRPGIDADCLVKKVQECNPCQNLLHYIQGMAKEILV